MKTTTVFANVSRVISIGGFLLMAVACGQPEGADDVVEGEVNVGTTPTIRVLPANPTPLGRAPHDLGGKMEVYVQSGQAQDRFTLGFYNVNTFPVSVCGAYTCNGQKTGFDISSIGYGGLQSVPITANGRNCGKGASFQYAYAVSKSAIPQSTCRSTRDRI